jgi:hypothetical protein
MGTAGSSTSTLRDCSTAASQCIKPHFQRHWPPLSSTTLFKHSPKIKPTTALLSQYMTSPPFQAGSSPKYQHHSSSPPVPSIARDAQGEWFDDLIRINQDLGARQSHHDAPDQRYGFANDIGQYQDLHGNDSNSHAPRACDPSLPFAARDEHELLRGMANYAVQSGPGTQNAQVGAAESVFSRDTASPYNTPPHSMQSTPPSVMEHTAPPDQPIVARQSMYDSFQHRFHTSEQARNHRRRATRFDREPYCDPESDPTVGDIEQNRPYHVMRIYNAMTSGESAKDNRGSIAMKRWVLDAHYPPDLVEAYAHKLFDCLLLQAKEGFRGWVHNDYVADERKGDDIDKDVDCAGRLENIILALEQEKTICEDVMNSACQIRMFVNAPRAYANRKHQNRVGNSKRGRTKDTLDANPRSAKTQKTGGRRKRARSTTAASDLPPSPGTTPQHQQLPRPVGSYHTSLSQQQQQLSPKFSFPTPHSVHLHRQTLSAPLHSLDPRPTIALSPPTSSPRTPLAPQLYTPRMATEPPHHQSPLYPPSPLNYNNYSAPASPDDAKPLATSTPPSNWYGSGFGDESYTQRANNGAAIDPALSLWDTLRPIPAHGVDGETNQYSDEYVNLADIEIPQSEHFAGDSNRATFGGFWENGV